MININFDQNTCKIFNIEKLSAELRTERFIKMLFLLNTLGTTRKYADQKLFTIFSYCKLEK